MRVVSQNRNYSFDFDRTIFWTQYNIIYAKIGVESIAIGKYESDKRAAEVFKEMHKLYFGFPVSVEIKEVNTDEIKEILNWENATVLSSDDSSRFEIVGNSVYYMPEV